MKIISWNCNLNIKGKFELIERYNPVIVFVQECEKLPLNYFPKYKYLANPSEIGMCTLHPGNITHKHGARPVTEGTRYVVVSFIKSKDHK